jgi:hypothetical protein
MDATAEMTVYVIEVRDDAMGRYTGMIAGGVVGQGPFEYHQTPHVEKAARFLTRQEARAWVGRLAKTWSHGYALRVVSRKIAEAR